MVSHMRSCDSMACGARRFTSGGGGIPCGSMRSVRSSASGAYASLSSRPGSRRLDRAPRPVIEGTALFEQVQHVFGTVGRPDGQLPMPVQIERTAPVDGLEAIVSHGNSLSSARHLAAKENEYLKTELNLSVTAYLVQKESGAYTPAARNAALTIARASVWIAARCSGPLKLSA